MPKSRQRKEDELRQLQDKLAKSKSIVFTSQRSVTVKALEQLRRDLRNTDSELQAIKKTLLGRAAKDQGFDLSGLQFEGMVGLAMSYGDEIAAAKAINAFVKENEGMKIVGGLLENQVIDASRVKALASLPGKQEMLGQVVRTIQAPVSGFVNVLAGNLRNFVQVMNAIKDAKSGS